MHYYKQKLMARLLCMVSFVLVVPTLSYGQQTFVQQHLGDNKIQGLKYINDRAIEFLRVYNQEHQTHWESLEPNAKYLVPKCAVPMTAQWGSRLVDGNKPTVQEERIYVLVKCNKTINGTSWRVEVPTSRPNRIIRQK